MRRLGTVRWITATFVALVLVAGVAGCRGAVPIGVAPTLDAVRALGLRCGQPQKDNVPSGLEDWRCEGLDRATAMTLLIAGDDKGVFDLTAFVPSSAGTATAREIFVDIVGILPVFESIRPATQSWLREWTGAADHLAIGAGSVTVDQTGTSILLVAIPGPRRAVGDPI